MPLMIPENVPDISPNHDRRTDSEYDVVPLRMGPSMLNAPEVSPTRSEP